MVHDAREIEYYRQIEDLFATLRGTPHILSPKDFQLLRTWWTCDVPLTAVMAGMSEVFLHHRERQEKTPIVSLSYCRHAIERHARRLAEAAVGIGEQGDVTPGEDEDRSELIAELTTTLRDRQGDLADEEPDAAQVVARIADQLERVGDLPSDQLEEHLYGLEQALLSGCLDALTPSTRETVENAARNRAQASGATGESLDRTLRAMLDREVRRHLNLPRLELV
ncbi:MAG: hypothetical protein GY906_05870 [bacterium]|nr:hypothetical protein [bacterium]